jgi:predicted flavoprotein YhiN
MRYHSQVLILGAGAAGLMCAIEAGKRGRSVTVLERSPRAGQKILISGGGRCNFTNLHCAPANFISNNPHFAKSALARYTPQDFLAMVERHGIRWHEKTLGQLFCDRSSQEILTMLEQECVRAAVRVKLGIEVREVRHPAVHQLAERAEHRVGAAHVPARHKGPDCSNSGAMRFTAIAGDDEYTADSLVVASGGLSIPKMGATAFGYDLARQFGLAIVEPRPALVPLTLSAEDARRWCDLSGVSTEVIASVRLDSVSKQSKGRQSFREKMLITHRGFSGPAILQISSYCGPGEPVRLDLAPEQRVFTPLTEPGARRDSAAALAALSEVLPARLAERWLDQAEQRLHGFEFVPSGTEGFGKAEVTAGGVHTDELSSRTIEAKKVPGLYFIGEVVDVTGHLGGFNFQWAWASGYSAGQAV